MSHGVGGTLIYKDPRLRKQQMLVLEEEAKPLKTSRVPARHPKS